MNAFLPSIARQSDPKADTLLVSALPQSRRRRWRFLLHPLTAICAVEAALSLTLVWSNTAFSNEADYLRIGHLEWAHWRYGASWPSAYAERFLSGSPFAYPPLGALADSIGGLAGARCLSLGFMLGATVLLYLTVSRLLGRGAAVVAAALWAFSEPAILQAFATFDPLATMLMALSAWLAVQVGYRRGRAALMTTSVAALALANVTAYSSLVIDPIVIAFAFLVWLSCMGLQQAVLRTVCFMAGLTVFFGVMVAASRSWTGLRFTVIDHSGSDRQSILIVFSNIWAYSGLIISIALVGMIVAIGTEGRRRSFCWYCWVVQLLVVPAAQLHDRQTSWSLDEHLGYGIWFAAMAAGYACISLVRWLPGVGKQVGRSLCIALAYPAAKSSGNRRGTFTMRGQMLDRSSARSGPSVEQSRTYLRFGAGPYRRILHTTGARLEEVERGLVAESRAATKGPERVLRHTPAQQELWCDSTLLRYNVLIRPWLDRNSATTGAGPHRRGAGVAGPRRRGFG